MADAPIRARSSDAPGYFASGVSFLVALLASLILQFAAVAKILGPNPKLFAIQPGQHGFADGVLLDYVVATGELVFGLLLMAFHRKRFVWPLVSMLFAAFAGYAFYYTFIRGEKCGCFGKLWEPPLGVSFAIDISMVFIALMVGGMLRLSKVAIVLVLLLNLALGYAGNTLAQRLAPPPRTETPGLTGADRLLASDLMKDIREQPPGSPRWYIFVYDPGCHVCEQMKPIVDMFEQQYAAGDPTLRIRQFSVPDLKAQLSIDDFEWSPTPTALLVHEGKVERTWRGEKAPLPDQEFAMHAAAGTLPVP